MHTLLLFGPVVKTQQEKQKEIAPTGNRTQGKCLEGIYVTTTPSALMLMFQIKCRSNIYNQLYVWKKAPASSPLGILWGAWLLSLHVPQVGRQCVCIWKYNDLDVWLQFIAFAIQLEDSSNNCSKVSSAKVGSPLSTIGYIAQFFEGSE